MLRDDEPSLPRAVCAPLCLALALGASGCSYSLNASVIPSAATDGEVGLEARVGLGVGLTDLWGKRLSGPRTAALMAAGYGGGSKSLSRSRSACGSLGGGLQYADVGHDPDRWGFRAGMFFGSDVCGLVDNPTTFSQQVALLYTLEQGPRKETTRYLTLGPVLESALLFAGSDSGDRGRFGLGLTLDWIHLTRWTIAM